uniref:Retrovirus-related Pol polyprotein from transposon TNT 1-94 n=1 Tax=Cajanus cajan TaxID=3821 RepID=A0A151R2U1_CAJCA|nr:Retrovirus-related Pol polyprotein from transposon TNT 1-94 [Cajanus cajan]
MLESMESSFKIRVAGCTWCYQIWSVLKTYFSSQTKARVKQIKIQLRNVCKTGPMSHYLLQIKQLTKTLATIGSPVSSEEHIDFIFDGLPEEYDPLETSCLTRSEPYTVLEIEALLLHQEERLERRKQKETETIQANLAQKPGMQKKGRIKFYQRKRFWSRTKKIKTLQTDEGKEYTYMKQLEGFNTQHPTLVCRLNKAIYGLQQAPRAWFAKLASTLITFGFKPAKCDNSLFILVTVVHTIYILVYVDDILITGSSPALIQNLINRLNALFPLKDLGKLYYFLGLQVHYDTQGSMLLTQSTYINNLLTKLNMQDSKPVKTPLPPSCRMPTDSTENFDNPGLYRSVLGALQYATITRPDIAYSVNKLC